MKKPKLKYLAFHAKLLKIAHIKFEKHFKYSNILRDYSLFVGSYIVLV